jgi:hypothetical protein
MTTIEHSTEGLTLDDTTVVEDYTIGCLSIPNRGGDTRLMWDSRNKTEVEAAKASFDKHLAAGYLAYKAEGKDGHRGEQIKQFDKRAERIVLVKPIAGG